jgi:hypothetical protein
MPKGTQAVVQVPFNSQSISFPVFLSSDIYLGRLVSLPGDSVFIKCYAFLML